MSWCQSYKKVIKNHRKTAKAELTTEEHAPLDKKSAKKLKYFKPSADYKVECQFTRTPDAEPFELPTYSGKKKMYVKYGVAAFELDDKKYAVAIYQSVRLLQNPEYKDYLFIPFKDLTNDESTYGGGRYMDITMEDIKGGKVTLDFNKAYNPWCAYSDGYNCPIPPTENHLEVEIMAGERKYEKK